MTLSRRGLFGMFAAGTAAAIVRTPGLLMPIKPVVTECSLEEATAAFRWQFFRVALYGHAARKAVRIDGFLKMEPLYVDFPDASSLPWRFS